MAQWKETLEPYVKVIESVKSAALNPTAGTDLIVGAVIVSDAGPTAPTLITSQKAFLATYASSDLTKEYTDSLDELYKGASGMWLNAYRLSGSGNLLITRAGKCDGIIYTKELSGDTTAKNVDYIIKDSEILKSVSSFKFVLDKADVAGKDPYNSDTTEVTTAKDGWAISIKDVGVFGNRVTDKGPVYDFYVDNLFDLVAKLNETTKFYTPACKYYSDVKCEDTKEITDPENNKSSIRTVLFNTVYVGQNMMEPLVDGEYWGYDSTGKTQTYWGDTVDSEGKKSPTGTSVDTDSTAVGCAYIIPATPTWEEGQPQGIINLNSAEYSGFSEPSYYVTNQYNSNKEIKVRVRRFNHDCVVSKDATGDESPYTILESVIKTHTVVVNDTDKTWTRKKPSADVLNRDFYEFAVLDPAISDEVQLFNVGNVSGRGDITPSDFKNMMSSMYFSLPDDLFKLNLDYYGYNPTLPTDYTWKEQYANGKYPEISYTNVQINSGNALLGATHSDILRAYDKIELDERYVVEGLTDLGNTESMIQNYIANIAVNSNYFYAASTTPSVNYMVIANKKSKVVKDSSKIYFLAPYDLDDGTVGYLFNACSSVIYWETVFKNRRNNQEFAAAFGQTHGITSVVNLAKEFNKTERQLLLTKKINTIFHDLYLDSIYINDNYTNQTEDNVMKEECNERLRIRISKAMPVLLNQFKGQQNTATVRANVVGVIDYWFKTVVMNYGSTISDYLITCNDELNPAEEIRANRLNVKVQVRFNSSIKYITVYEEAYPIGVEFGE